MYCFTLFFQIFYANSRLLTFLLTKGTLGGVETTGDSDGLPIG